MFDKCRRKLVAENRASDIEPVSLLDQQLTDPSGARTLLMENDQDWTFVVLR
jgi:hypothetical protein